MKRVLDGTNVAEVTDVVALLLNHIKMGRLFAWVLSVGSISQPQEVYKMNGIGKGSGDRTSRPPKRRNEMKVKITIFLKPRPI